MVTDIRTDGQTLLYRCDDASKNGGGGVDQGWGFQRRIWCLTDHLIVNVEGRRGELFLDDVDENSKVRTRGHSRLRTRCLTRASS